MQQFLTNAHNIALVLKISERFSLKEEDVEKCITEFFEEFNSTDNIKKLIGGFAQQKKSTPPKSTTKSSPNTNKPKTEKDKLVEKMRKIKDEEPDRILNVSSGRRIKRDTKAKDILFVKKGDVEFGGKKDDPKFLKACKLFDAKPKEKSSPILGKPKKQPPKGKGCSSIAKEIAEVKKKKSKAKEDPEEEQIDLDDVLNEIEKEDNDEEVALEEIVENKDEDPELELSGVIDDDE